MILFDDNEIIADKFQIMEQVSSGGQSVGYVAEDITIQSRYAWKRKCFIKQYSDLPLYEKEYPRVKAHFAEISSRLRSDIHLICAPTDICMSHEHGSVIGVFPFVDGVSLKKTISENISHIDRVRIAFALVNGVRKLHKSGIAHLDLKPDNVVYNNSTNNKIFINLIDLDGSKVDGVGIRSQDVKTLYYSSPEHFTTDKTTAQSDVFSLAITILELLLGIYPLDIKGIYEIAITNVMHKVPICTLHNDIIRTLLRCLILHPYDRPTAGKILHVFNKHFDNQFIALTDKEKFNPNHNACSVQIVSHFKGTKFSRVYYESTLITSQEMRGSGIENLKGNIFALIIVDGCAYIQMDMHAQDSINMDEYPLTPGRFYLLLQNQTLQTKLPPP